MSTYAVSINNIDDNGQFSVIGSVADQSGTTDFNVSFENLFFGFDFVNLVSFLAFM